MTMLPIDDAIHLIAEFEGLRLAPYLDSAGIPTIGFGCTHYPSGKAVTLNDPPITADMARSMLLYFVQESADQLWPELKRLPTTNEWLALVSISYNEGVHAIVNSLLLFDFNAGNISVAADQFLRWDKQHVKGVVVQSHGLLKRRQKERAIFLTSDQPQGDQA